MYSEVREENKSGEYFKDLNNAKRIFLGFGYHEQNLLASGMTKKVLLESLEIFGTAYNMSNGEKKTKKERISQSINLQKRVSRDVILSNDWNDKNPKDSIISDFFRNVQQADLV